MTKISWEHIWLFKRLFPVLWFGSLATFFLGRTLTGVAKVGVMVYVMPALMAIIGFVMLKKSAWDLVDAVYDGGDFLLVKNGGQEDRILLSNIMNVSASDDMSFPRITLRLASPSLFGSEIIFAPAVEYSLNPFARNRVAEDLIFRVDQARSRRSSWTSETARRDAPVER